MSENLFYELIKDALKITKIDNIDPEISAILNYLELPPDYKITKIGTGTYSTVYQIGHKVIKIGLAKLNSRIINNPNIIKTYLKTNISVTHGHFNQLVGIEIQDLATIKSVSKEKLYELYKNLRQDNIIWNDIKEDNAGYIQDKLVVIDTDYLYFVNEEITFLREIDKEFFIQ